AWREACHVGRELDRARVRVRPVRVEGQLAHLRGSGLADLVAVRIADLHREEARQRVEVALPVGVLEVTAFAADDDRNLAVEIAAHAREVQPEVVPRGLLELSGREARGRDRHVAPLVALADRYCQTTFAGPRMIA